MHIHIKDPSSECSICNGSENILREEYVKFDKSEFDEVFLRRKTLTGWALVKSWLKIFLP